MSTFKYKPDKIKYLNSVNTLDNTHRKMTSSFEKCRNEIPIKKMRIERMQKQLNELEKKDRELYTAEDTKKRSLLKNEIRRFAADVSNSENYSSEIDYYSKTDNLLFDYYDIVEKNMQCTVPEEYNDDDNDNNNDDTATDQATQSERMTNNTESYTESDNFNSNRSVLEKLNLKSQEKRKIKKPTKRRLRKNQPTASKNILDYFSGGVIEEGDEPEISMPRPVNKDTDNEEKQSSIVHIVSNKATLYDEFMTIIDTGYISSKKQRYNLIKKCGTCNVEKVLRQAEGSYVCVKCGEFEQIIIESEVPNFKDPIQDKRPMYKRLVYFSG